MKTSDQDPHPPSKEHRAEPTPVRGAADPFDALRSDLRRVYDGMKQIGADRLSGARTVEELSEDLSISRSDAAKAVEELEGQGIVGRLTTGTSPSFFARR